MIMIKLFNILKHLHNKPNSLNKGSFSFPYFFIHSLYFMKSKYSHKSFYSFLFSLIPLILSISSACTQSPNFIRSLLGGQPIIHDTTFVIDTVITHDTLFIPQSQNLIKLTVDSVRVDSSYGELTGDKMIDGIPAFVNDKKTNSRWAVEGYPHYAMFYFNGLVHVNKIRINLYKGDERFTNHIKFYNFSDLLWAGDVGDSLWNNIHLKFYGSSIYLEVSGASKNLKGITNNWTDIGEIEFYGYD